MATRRLISLGSRGRSENVVIDDAKHPVGGLVIGNSVIAERKTGGFRLPTYRTSLGGSVLLMEFVVMWIMS